jgi:hypothetical protein
MRPNIPQFELILPSRSRFSPCVTSLLRGCGAHLGPKRSSMSWHVILSCSCSTCPFRAVLATCDIRSPDEALLRTPNTASRSLPISQRERRIKSNQLLIYTKGKFTLCIMFSTQYSD